jgi:hypothetical protein
MKSNESSIDRISRMVLGIVLGLLVGLKAITGTAAIAVGIGAAILFFTGAAGFCALYALAGVTTLKIRRK